MFNCGMMAVEVPADKVEELFSNYAGKETTVTTDFGSKKFTISADGNETVLEFSISGFDESLVKAGGWVDYADSNY